MKLMELFQRVITWMTNATSPITLHIIHNVIDAISTLDLNYFFETNMSVWTIGMKEHLNGLRSCEYHTIMREIFPPNHAVFDDTGLELNEIVGP